MNIRSAKAKGKRLAMAVKEKLVKTADLHDDDIYVPVGSVPGEDILFSPKAREFFNLAIECKNQESLNIWEALKQAEGHAKGTNRIPLVIFSRNHSKTYAALEFDHFLELTKRDGK